jgi:hypothetical protein
MLVILQSVMVPGSKLKLLYETGLFKIIKIEVNRRQIIYYGIIEPEYESFTNGSTLIP